MAIELVPLCTIRIQLKPPIEVGAGPAGHANDLRARQRPGQRRPAIRGAAGNRSRDWAVLGPEGTGTLDIREALRTDDGAVIFVQYNGRLDASQGLQFPMTIYIAPRFETGDERYAWLNRIQAVGKGTLNQDLSLDYEWYEVR